MRSAPFLALFLALLAGRPVAAAVCSAQGAPTQLRSEGVTERVGDIQIECSGAVPNRAITTNLTIYLSSLISNRLSSSSGTIDASLSADTGGGFVPLASSAFLNSSYVLSFNGLTVTPGADGAFRLRVSGIRVNASRVPLNNPVTAYLAFSGSGEFVLTSNMVTLGLPLVSLFTSQSDSLVNCYGSPLPATVSLTNLFAETAHSVTRVTEALPNAFEKRDPATMDTGVRFILRFSGFPSTARVFLPNLVAGSSATQPTLGQGLGSTPTVGQYTPSSLGSLLLGRVLNADANGAGGTVVALPGAGTTLLDTAAEVNLTDGAGYAVFEVLDANPYLAENAQIPVFLSLTSLPAGGGEYNPQVTVAYGPVSKENQSVAGAPVPRFTDSKPASDCTLLNDCDASFRPRLAVNGASIEAYTTTGVRWENRYFNVINVNAPGSSMPWTSTIHYLNGDGWIRMDRTSAPDAITVRADLLGEKLAPGVYRATILIDAGAAGQKSVDVTLHVDSSTPVLSAYGNAASGKGPLVAGSLALLTGSGLDGEAFSVTFDGQPAELVSKSAAALQVVVPSSLAGKASAEVVVSANGKSSAPFPVALAAVAPAVFDHGVLNADGSPNTEQTPEPPGGMLLVRVTGLPMAGVTARIGDRDVLQPLIDTVAGLPGVLQVHVPVPGDFGGGATVILCAPDPATSQKVCTEPALLYVTLP